MCMSRLVSVRVDERLLTRVDLVDFLSEDPTYARYMQRVRYRWIPGLA